MAYYPGGRLYAVREIGDAHTSVHYDEISHMAASNPDARILLAQLWAAPAKAPTGHADRLAPFAGRDGSGREWLFAFDGLAGNDRKTGEPFAPEPLAQMCSERIFQSVLKHLGGAAGPQQVRDAVKGALEGVAAAFEFDHLNLAVSDGTAVYMARYAERESEWNELWYARLPRALVGCSQPLKTVEHPWEKLENRRLVVFDPAQNIQKLEL